MLKLALVAGLMLSLLWAGRAEATHEPINVDGNLADLVGAISRNSGGSNGGFVIPDIANEVYTSSCRFVNGYDVRNYYYFLDFKTPTGGTSSNVRLFGGWDVYGVIGDVDGDGNPNTYNPPATAAGCPLSDEPGIGPLESYTIEIDYDCVQPAQAEQRIVIKNGRVFNQLITTTGVIETDITAQSQFSFVGGSLELMVNEFDDLIPPAFDICTARIRMTANAELDLLGEDRSETLPLALVPALAVTKTVITPAACAGDEVVWSIVVTNDGLCDLRDVFARDTLDAGMTFVSSTPTRTSGDDRRSVFSFGNLAAGESRTITLRSRTATTCPTATLVNSVGVAGNHVPPPECAPSAVAEDRAIASIPCSPCTTVCDITVSPSNAVCVGTPIELCGPTGAFTYRWILPGGSILTSRCVNIAAATIADSGLYILQVTSGATTTACSTRIAVSEIVCSIEGPKVVCAGSRVELCGPMGPYIYRWTTPGGATRTTRCIVIDPATEVNSGIYTLVITDPATGCTATCTHELVVSPLPPAKINGPNIVCFGAPVELCAAEGPYNYVWTLPNGGTTSSRCVTIASAALIHNGSYRLIIIDRASGCRDTVDHLLTVRTPPTCTITGPTSVCLNASFTLTGPAAPAGITYAYRWTTPTGQVINSQSVTITAATEAHSGVYTLVVTDLTYGCTNTCSQSVAVTAPPCEITGPSVVCEGTNVQLCGPEGNFTFLWTLPGGATRTTRCINLPAVTPANSGVYTLRVTDNVTGCTRTCEHKLAVNPRPPCTITGPTTVCVGAPLQLCGPEGGYNYRWTLPDGTVRTSRCVTIPVADIANSGLYSLWVIDPVTACSTSCDRKVTVLPPPPCTITGPDAVCAGGPAELCGPVGAFTYLWTLPNGTTRTTRCVSIPAATAGDAGLYTLRVTDPATTCVSTCTKTLRVGASCTITQTIPTTPPTTPGVTAVCAGQTFELCGPEGPFSYLWTLPNGTTRTTRCISVTAATPADAGIYSLRVIDPAVPQCPATCTWEVRVGAPPCSITGPTVVCAGSPALLCGPEGSFGYLWTLPNGSTLTTRCVSIASASASNAGRYILRVTDLATACAVSCTTTLSVGGPPCTIRQTIPTPPTAPPPPPGVTAVCTGETFELCGPTGAFTYLWTLPDGSTRTTACVRIDAALARHHGTWRLTVTDPTVPQCPTTCTWEVRVNTPPPCLITGPTEEVLGSPVELCGPTGNFDYRWTLPNGSNRTTQCISIPSLSPADTGLYQLRVTDRTTGCVSTCSHRLRLAVPCKLVVTKTASPTEVTPGPGASCETVGKPKSITFRYTGQGCDASNNDQAAGKWSCTDLGNLGEPVQLVYTGNNSNQFSVSPSGQTIGIGDLVTVTTTRNSFHADSEFEIRRNGVAVERLMIHTSCSQPLAVGDVFGSLVIAGLNGETGSGSDVTYSYTVTNYGTPLYGVTLVDDKLGHIGGPFDLGINASRSFSRTVEITETTVNRVVATGHHGSPTGPLCEDAATATVTVVEPGLTCKDGKPVQLVFAYTGETCAASDNDQTDWSCTDHAALTQPVRVVYTGRDPERFTVTPADESIRPGDLVTFTAVGTSRIYGESRFEIRRGSTVLQSIRIHTSCSQPLNVGDQWGSLELRVFRISAEPILVPTETELGAPGSDADDSQVTLESPAPIASSLRFAMDVRPATVFQGRATIGFSITRGGPVRLSVLDVQGRAVATLANGHWSAGTHQVDWDPSTSGVSTGIYFIRLEAPEGVLTRKVARLR